MKIVDATVFAGVYGALRRHPWLRDTTHDQDVYSLFTARAAAMGWSSVRGEVGLWGMNDAGQDWAGGDAPTRVAWVQVAAAEPAPHGVPVQPVLAGVRDTVARVGELDLTAVQMLLPVQTARPAREHLLTGLNWFATTDPAARVAVRVLVDSGDATVRVMAADILAAVQHDWTGPFRIEDLSDGPAPAVTEPAVVGDMWMGPTREPVTFACSVPEWTMDAVGWLSALFVDGCREAGVRTTVLLDVAPAPAG